jgi:hypothetical protein
MKDNDVRKYQEVAKVISRYAHNNKDFLKKMRQPEWKKKKKKLEYEKIIEKKKEEPITEFKEKGDKSELGIDLDIKIKAFKEIESIDEDTAILLYDNGFTNIDSLKNSSFRDLIKIEGIKRKTAKKIFKELNVITNEKLSGY